MTARLNLPEILEELYPNTVEFEVRTDIIPPGQENSDVAKELGRRMCELEPLMDTLFEPPRLYWLDRASRRDQESHERDIVDIIANFDAHWENSRDLLWFSLVKVLADERRFLEANDNNEPYIFDMPVAGLLALMTGVRLTDIYASADNELNDASKHAEQRAINITRAAVEMNGLVDVSGHVGIDGLAQLPGFNEAGVKHFEGVTDAKTQENCKGCYGSTYRERVSGDNLASRITDIPATSRLYTGDGTPQGKPTSISDSIAQILYAQEIERRLGISPNSITNHPGAANFILDMGLVGFQSANHLMLTRDPRLDQIVATDDIELALKRVAIANDRADIRVLI